VRWERLSLEHLSDVEREAWLPWYSSSLWDIRAKKIHLIIIIIIIREDDVWFNRYRCVQKLKWIP
jgi:hypothetical protein